MPEVLSEGEENANWQEPKTEATQINDRSFFERIGDKVRAVLPYAGLLLLTSGATAEAKDPAQERLMIEGGVKMAVQAKTLEVFSPESVKIVKEIDPDTGEEVEVRHVEGYLRPSDGLFKFFQASRRNVQEVKKVDQFERARADYKGIKQSIDKKTDPETAKKIEKIIAARMLKWGGDAPAFNGHLPDESTVQDLMTDVNRDIMAEVDLLDGDVDSKTNIDLLDTVNDGELRIARDLVGHWWQESQRPKPKH